jgi:hypothetical protein
MFIFYADRFLIFFDMLLRVMKDTFSEILGQKYPAVFFNWYTHQIFVRPMLNYKKIISQDLRDPIFDLFL